MRVSNRVTNTAMNRNFSSSVNNVHSALNKSMNKISSGKAYESASDNPLAYYEGKKIDNQYQDVESKMALIGDIQKRLEEQEGGAYSIQTNLSEAQSRLVYVNSDTNGATQTLETIKQDLLQRAQSMVNSLNAQYQDYYIFGGNDVSTNPFSLSADGTTLTFNHKFPGKDTFDTMTITFDPDAGTVSIDKPDLVLQAMKEQGYVDLGQGTISRRDTLIDTYTSGLGVLTGLNADALKAMNNPIQEITDRLAKSPVFLLAQGADLCDKKASGSITVSQFHDKMGTLIDDITETHANVGTVYSDLGNKWSNLETLEAKLKKQSQSLEEQYKDKLGADPYEAITEMFSYQYSYNAALQVGSRLMQSSLFDFLM